MTKTFSIFGFIVDEEVEATSFEDVRPSQLRSFINTFEEGDELELKINSFGGSVSAGLAISNILKEASKNGHKTTAHVIGFACSTASFIACSCDDLKIDSTSFLMIHNPYTFIAGNANDLRKEALVLDKMKESIIEIYRSKFRLDENEISSWMDAETWIRGNEASEIINCEVIPTQENEDEDEKDIIVNVKANRYLNKIHLPDNVKVQPIEDKTEEKHDEKLVEYETIEKRISGIQSAMAKQMNKMKSEYADKISNLENEIKVKDEELMEKENTITNLHSELDNSSKKLDETLSVLKEKENALLTLNSEANQKPVDNEIDWRNLKGQAFFDYIKKHPELTKNN